MASSDLSVSVGAAPWTSVVKFSEYFECLPSVTRHILHSFLTIVRSRSVGTGRGGTLCTLTRAYNINSLKFKIYEITDLDLPWPNQACGVAAARSTGSLHSNGKLATLLIKLNRVLIQIRRKMKENVKYMTNYSHS